MQQLRCPKCGSANVHEEGSEQHWIRCGSCGLETEETCDSVELAYLEWEYMCKELCRQA